MRELVDSEIAIRQVVGEEVVWCCLACVHHRFPQVSCALRESYDGRQVAGVEGHVDLAFCFIFLW